MSWWGKLAGGGIGFALGGPIGAMLGAILGHQVDKANRNKLTGDFGRGTQERTQAVFFTTTFSVMGHISKADGFVSPQEIQMAEQLFKQMNFSQDQRAAAIELFNQGKGDDFKLDDVLAQFKQECGRKLTLIQMFMEIQLQAVYADGKKHPAEEQILQHICARLGYPKAMLTQMEALLFAQQRRYSSDANVPPSRSEIDQAYAVLGVDKNANQGEVKKAYRRLMSQHHPDKLIAKGLPEEMVQVATDKSKEIQKAYELIKKIKKLQ